MTAKPRLVHGLAAAGLATLLSSCALGPGDGEPLQITPDLAAADFIPTQWAAPQGQIQAGDPSQDLRSFWRAFNDPTLYALVERAITSNFDIEQAAHRYAQAEARFGLARDAQMPTLSASASYGGAPLRPDGARFSNISPELALSWDADLGGRLKKSRRIAAAELRAAGYDVASVQRAIAAEVAENYFQLLVLNNRRANLMQTLKAQRELLEMVAYRVRIGLSPAFDEEQARLRVLSYEAEIPQIEQQQGIIRNRLAVLLGTAPGSIDYMLPHGTNIGGAPIFLGAGTPADVLRRRPDLLSAEERVLIAGENLGIARAAIWPSFSLRASLSSSSFSIASLADSLVGQVVGSLTAVIFNGGQRKRNIAEREAAAMESIAAYRGTTLKAFEEVENALILIETGQRRLVAEERALASAERALELAQGQYRIGLIDLFLVLDAQQTLNAQSDAVAQARADVAVGHVRLYIALGGGW